eukprot:Gb_03630 [translate_table: standard]
MQSSSTVLWGGEALLHHDGGTGLPLTQMGFDLVREGDRELVGCQGRRGSASRGMAPLVDSLESLFEFLQQSWWLGALLFRVLLVVHLLRTCLISVVGGPVVRGWTGVVYLPATMELARRLAFVDLVCWWPYGSQVDGRSHLSPNYGGLHGLSDG